jgi:hypothetical protein
MEAKCRIRIMAVHFSREHPDLLDAGVANTPWGQESSALAWRENATNGLHIFLPLDPIAPAQYFTNYQCALVLGGIGAAYRLTWHLAWGTAVVLQPFHDELWYTRFLVPNVHIIPIAKDGSNITEVMRWIQANPTAVQRIGAAGQAFYEYHLAERPFAHMLERWLGKVSEMQAKLGELGGEIEKAWPRGEIEKAAAALCAPWGCSCQTISDTYGTHPGKWGRLKVNGEFPPNMTHARDFWLEHDCKTHPK